MGGRSVYYIYSKLPVAPWLWAAVKLKSKNNPKTPFIIIPFILFIPFTEVRSLVAPWRKWSGSFKNSTLRVCILLVLIFFMVTLIPSIPSQSHEENTEGIGARLMSVIPGARGWGGLSVLVWGGCCSFYCVLILFSPNSRKIETRVPKEEKLNLD